MISIINPSGRILELYADTAIPVERYNSLFTTADKLIQDIMYSAKAGLTENNKLFIENGHLVESKNSVYQLPGTTLLVNGTLYLSGNFTYTIINDEIEFIMKVNLSALVYQIKNTRLTEIRTEDGIYVPNLNTPDFHNNGNTALMAERMKQSCLHPDQYPFAYFPVSNPLSIVKHEFSVPEPLTNFVNFWKYSAQTFMCANGTEVPVAEYPYTVHSPFFKVTYILEKVFAYLNLSVAGDFFSDPEYASVYIYTRKTNMHQEDFASLDPSMTYMPNITIAEFLRQVKERMRLMIDIDTLNGIARVRTSTTIISDPEYLDLSDYVESISEFGDPDQKGYRVYLTPDEQDELFVPEVAGSETKAPDYRMIVGDGTTDTPMAASTLKRVDDPTGFSFPATKQRCTFFFRRPNSPDLEDNALPPSDPNDPTTINNWPLRLLKFSGMKPVAPNMVFPEAIPYELDAVDAEWWRFRNDTKPVIIMVKVPLNILERLSHSPKIGVLSNEGMPFQALYEKYSYTISNRNEELIPVKIEGYIILKNLSTPVVFEKVEQSVAVENTGYFCTVKAYFDTTVLKEVVLEAFSIVLGQAIFDGGTLKESTDSGGGGGGRVVIRRTSGAARAGIILSVKHQPKYLYYNGRRMMFTQLGEYWQVNINWRYDNAHQSYWIVF